MQGVSVLYYLGTSRTYMTWHYTTTQNSDVTKLTSYGALVVGGNFHVNEAK